MTSLYSQVRRTAANALIGFVFLTISTIDSHAQDTGPYSSCPLVEDEIVDLEMLTSALRDTPSLGSMTKLRLKSDIKKLLRRINTWHAGNNKYTIEQLQEQYDLLLMKLATLLQDRDLYLHQQLCNAWPAIWADLQDPQRARQLRRGT